MKLLTKTIEKKLPNMYETEDTPTQDKVVHVKYFCPWNHWTWYGVEYDPEFRTFFGYVVGHDNEWGYFDLESMETVTGPFGLKIERDLHWTPKKFSEINC